MMSAQYHRSSMTAFPVSLMMRSVAQRVDVVWWRITYVYLRVLAHENTQAAPIRLQRRMTSERETCLVTSEGYNKVERIVGEDITMKLCPSSSSCRSGLLYRTLVPTRQMDIVYVKCPRDKSYNVARMKAMRNGLVRMDGRA